MLFVKKLQNKSLFNPLNAELNPICRLLALLGAHYIFHVSGIRVKPHFYTTAAHIKFLIGSNPIYYSLNKNVHNTEFYSF